MRGAVVVGCGSLVALLLSMSSCGNTDTKESCTPGEKFCEGKTLRQCTTDGSNSVLLEICEDECDHGQCITFWPPVDSLSPDEISPTDIVDDMGKDESTGEVAKPDIVCADECQAGDTICSGIKVLHECVQDEDGCWVFDEGEPCDDGNPCTDDACAVNKGCVIADNTEPCDDQDPCTIGDICEDGECLPGDEDLECNDANECTIDLCEPGVGCTVENVAQGFPCADDGNPCTSDFCQGGECVHPNAADGLPCGEGKTCNSGACEAQGCAPDCPECQVCQGNFCVPGADGVPCSDDGNECTIDVCADGYCSHPAVVNGTPCGEGNTCQNGACMGTCVNGDKRRCWVECSQDYVDECLLGNSALIMGIETCQGAEWGACVVEMSCGVLSLSCVNASNAPTTYKCLDGTPKQGHMTCFQAMGASCTTSYYSGWGPGDCPDLCTGPGDACDNPGESQPCEVHCDSPSGPVKEGTINCSQMCASQPVWSMCNTDQACNP